MSRSVARHGRPAPLTGVRAVSR
ncbi:hypothetical protein [Streptantibioticus parmotrematis]